MITGEDKGKSAHLQLILNLGARSSSTRGWSPCLPRDRSFRVNPNLSSRLRFSKKNLMGWSWSSRTRRRNLGLVKGNPYEVPLALSGFSPQLACFLIGGARAFKPEPCSGL